MIAAIYTRVSTQEQAKEGYSIHEQEERLKKFCDAMNWTVYKVYTDAGFSGATADRPALQMLISDAEYHAFDKVVVYKLDRLSRSQKDTLMLIEDKLLRNGVDFVSMSENFDTATPFGRAMIGILAVFAQLEREQIKERMMLGKEARAKQGKYQGGKSVPIGYDYIDGNLVVNEYEKMQVQRIFQMFLEGKSITAIAKQLAAEGLRHKHGTWNRETVRHILKSRTYLGELKYQKKWFLGEQKPLIDINTHTAVKERLDAQSAAFTQHKRRGRVNSLLGGYLVCGVCGTTMSKKVQGEKQRPYYCCYSRMKKYRPNQPDLQCTNKSWRMEDLDALVLGEMKKLRIEDISVDTPNNPLPPALDAELKKTENQIDRLLDLYADGTIPREQLDEKIKLLNEKRSAIVAQIEHKKRPVDTERLQKSVASISDVIERGIYEEQRALVEALINRIVINGNDIEIHWNF